MTLAQLIEILRGIDGTDDIDEVRILDMDTEYEMSLRSIFVTRDNALLLVGNGYYHEDWRRPDERPYRVIWLHPDYPHPDKTEVM